MGRIEDSGAEWLRGVGPESDVVISSRVRLARNIAGFPFVNRASREDRQVILDIARRQILGDERNPGFRWVDLNTLRSIERARLVERQLISKQHAKGHEPRAVAVSQPAERLAVMVNEEDHLRLQSLRSGLDLAHAFEQINALDDRIESRVDYAYSPRWGYLTACPTNVGTGIRVSVMIHIPALKLTNELEKVQRAAKAMNLAIRGFHGEGSEASGDLYQISNQTTLGRSEDDILYEFDRTIMPKVLEYERAARRSLLDKRRSTLEDRVFRALGTLTHARLLKADEALQLLSYLRLGISTDIVRDVDLHTVNQLILLTQPAHMQSMAREPLDQAQRRVERASLVRNALAAG